MNQLVSKLQQRYRELIDQNQCPPALLFYGEQSADLRQLTKSIACHLLAITEDCDEHVDWICLDEEERIKVDAIRALQQFLYATPHQARCRVIVIHQADEMTLQAANALLKILEEPPENRFFILTARSLQKLPLTVVSRCQKVYCPSTRKEETWTIEEQNFIEQLLELSVGESQLLEMLRSLQKKQKISMLNVLHAFIIKLIKLKSNALSMNTHQVVQEKLFTFSKQLQFDFLLQFEQHIVEQKRAQVERLDILLVKFFNHLTGSYV